MGVAAEHAVRELVAVRLADDRGAGGGQPGHDRGVAFGHRVGGEPVGVAGAGGQPGDVDDVLHGQA